jgi:hypothetical protein
LRICFKEGSTENASILGLETQNSHYVARAPSFQMIHQSISSSKPLWVQPLLLAGLYLPWLSPFTSGPSPAVLPWLVTLVCVALVLLLIGASEFVKPGTVALAWFVALG